MPPVLFWRNHVGATKAVSREPFKSEADFEKTVFETPAVLGDMYLLQRQVRGGRKAGIPDIVGIDSEGAVCVIEMKNVLVDVGIIPQVLQYALWAEGNPDSIRALWLESKDRPDNLEVEWDGYSVRIVVIAPQFDRTTLEHVNKIAYPVDLVEITRWTDGEDSWLLVNRLEPFIGKRVKPVAGAKEHGADDYIADGYKPPSVAGFMKACDALQSTVEKNHWPVERHFRKDYCTFKIGSNNVFGICWVTARKFAVFVKVPESFGAKNKIQRCESWYEKQWKERFFDITDLAFNPTDFKAFFEKALEQRLGTGA